MSDFVSLHKAIQKNDFLTEELYDLKEAIESRIQKKKDEKRESMYQVNVNNFTFATLRNTEFDLALEIFNKKMKEENLKYYASSGSIDVIRVKESEVDNLRSIW